MPSHELHADVLIIGASTGGVAAALGAAALGKSVILTEEYDWIGGQLTSQAVPPDENARLRANKRGGTARYLDFRRRARDYYRRNLPLTDKAKRDPRLNPGGGGVSPICMEPRIALAALEEMLAPHRTSGRVRDMTGFKPIGADVQGDRVRSVALHDLRENRDITLSAPFVLDATDLGELLPLAKCEYVTGAESQKQTDEPHAPQTAQPENIQALTWCFAAAFDPEPGADHTIDKPQQYARWRDYVPHLAPAWPGRMLSWTYTHPGTDGQPTTRTLFPNEVEGRSDFWTYRKIIRNDIYQPGFTPHEVTLVNWPMNDYLEHSIIDKPAENVAVFLEEARQLSLSLMYWMQTEAPRGEGKAGYPGLYLRPDLMGTHDGLAQAPYIRESRRMRTIFTVTEKHVGLFGRYGVDRKGRKPGMTAEHFKDSVGIGHYNIDLHPTTGGKNYIDIPSLPFQIPLGALIPMRMENLLPACKNLGVTHITNGCYRLHPVEWNIGEAAGLLAGFCLDKKLPPRAIREDSSLLGDFQSLLKEQGIPLEWA